MDYLKLAALIGISLQLGIIWKLYRIDHKIDEINQIVEDIVIEIIELEV
tara:strand:+ start:331 stop:477 length:147 start_codon:yes stop_codon:yes gene_type:complete